jgi:molecular chaperone GrpE
MKETMVEEEEPSKELTTEEQLQAEVAEWKDLAQRKAAEVENIRRRAAEEKQHLARYAAEHLITHLLPVLDDLHSALDSARTSDDSEALRTGLEMIYKKAVKIFEEHGVTIIDHGPGQPFDVELHEALMHVPHEELPEGHIIQTVQRGYALHEKILRYAKVITSAGLPEHKDDADKEKA